MLDLSKLESVEDYEATKETKKKDLKSLKVLIEEKKIAIGDKLSPTRIDFIDSIYGLVPVARGVNDDYDVRLPLYMRNKIEELTQRVYHAGDSEDMTGTVLCVYHYANDTYNTDCYGVRLLKA